MVYTNHLYPFMVIRGMVYYCYTNISSITKEYTVTIRSSLSGLFLGLLKIGQRAAEICEKQAGTALVSQPTSWKPTKPEGK